MQWRMKMSEHTKVCSKCDTEKPITEYYKRSPAAGGGREAFCKDCKRVYYKREHRWRHLKERYNITKEEYEDRYAMQEGRCGICSTYAEVLCVDHDHKTGDVRGLLCSPCNRSLGQLGDDIESIKRTLEYLEQ